LTYYWRTNTAVVAGVATAVSVLAGALLVGDSVRGSLRDLVVGRLGKTDHVIASTTFFRERLADDLRAQPDFTKTFSGIAPLVVAQGLVTEQESGRRAGQVRVYGVDDRFWRFHAVEGVTGPENRDAFISPALAEQLGSVEGSSLRAPAADRCPTRSLRAQTRGRTLRLTSPDHLRRTERVLIGAAAERREGGLRSVVTRAAGNRGVRACQYVAGVCQT
jgi:hypothetical protein